MLTNLPLVYDAYLIKKNLIFFCYVNEFIRVRESKCPVMFSLLQWPDLVTTTSNSSTTTTSYPELLLANHFSDLGAFDHFSLCETILGCLDPSFIVLCLSDNLLWVLWLWLLILLSQQDEIFLWVLSAFLSVESHEQFLNPRMYLGPFHCQTGVFKYSIDHPTSKPHCTLELSVW